MTLQAKSPLTVAIFPWGDVVEEFLEPIGLGLEDFARRMTGGWLFGYVAALHSAGHRAIVICASEKVAVITRYEHADTSASIWVVPGKRPRRSQISSVQSLRQWLTTPWSQYRKVLTREHCTTVLVQEYEYHRFDALTLLAHRLKLPVYATFQGGDRTLSWIESMVRRQSLRKCAGLIVASAQERNRLNQSYRGVALNVIDIPNPVDVHKWLAFDRHQARKELSLADETFIVVNHGRIDIHRKGLDILIDAWKMFGYEASSQLVIIGSGQDHDAFADILAGSNLSNVRWLSDYTTDWKRIRLWLSAADVYVTASRTEGMPVAPLEAMACGLPVITSGAQGLPDILTNGELSGGLVVRSERPNDYAEALRKLKNDAPLRARLGLTARHRIEQGFSISAIGTALAAFLTSG